MTPDTLPSSPRLLLVPLLGALAVASVPADASAQLLRHDSWTAGAAANVQVGLCLGECAAVTFEAPEGGFDLTHAYFFIGPAPGFPDPIAQWQVRIMDVVDGGWEPIWFDARRTEVVTATGRGPVEVDFAAATDGSWGPPVRYEAGERFAIGMCFEADTFVPLNDGGGPATDSDGFSNPNGSWIWAFEDPRCIGDQYWLNAADAGVSGDWIIWASDGPLTGGLPGDDDDDDDDDDDSTPGDDDDATQGDDDDDATGDDDDSADLGVAIYSIDPSQTQQGESISFQVLGSGFEAGTELHIGGLRVTTQLVDERKMLGDSPSGLVAGIHDVEVRNPDGSVDVLPSGFEVVGGCGCTTAAPRGAGGWLWLGLLVALAGPLRRRR